MKPVRATSEVNMTTLGPYRSAAHPLTIRPRIPPAEEPLESPDCQAGGMAYPISVAAGTPKRRKKAAKQEHRQHLSVLSP
jgi:hypothetical protein